MCTVPQMHDLALHKKEAVGNFSVAIEISAVHIQRVWGERTSLLGARFIKLYKEQVRRHKESKSKSLTVER